MPDHSTAGHGPSRGYSGMVLALREWVRKRNQPEDNEQRRRSSAGRRARKQAKK